MSAHKLEGYNNRSINQIYMPKLVYTGWKPLVPLLKANKYQVTVD